MTTNQERQYITLNRPMNSLLLASSLVLSTTLAFYPECQTTADDIRFTLDRIGQAWKAGKVQGNEFEIRLFQRIAGELDSLGDYFHNIGYPVFAEHVESLRNAVIQAGFGATRLTPMIAGTDTLYRAILETVPKP